MKGVLQTRIIISYPDVELPPINLLVVVPPWYFYATIEEREQYYKDLLNNE